MNQNTIPADVVRSLLDYNPESGEFFWKPRERDAFLRDRSWRHWNKNMAGKRAGGICALGYMKIRIGDKIHSAHRLAWLLCKGRLPPHDLDHINRVRSDNRIINLREATRSQNVVNSKIQSNNKSGHRGVFWRTREQKWEAQIKCQKKNYYLGTFTDKDAAIAAYRKKAVELFGEFASLTGDSE